MSRFVRLVLKKMKSEDSEMRFFMKNAWISESFEWRRGFFDRFAVRMQKVREHWERSNASDVRLASRV